jgi:nuclear pore complex protein Nup93
MLGPDDRYTREKESKFAEKVQELNAARLQRRPFPILQEFAHVEAQSTDQHVRDVVNGYEALMEMVGEYSEGPEHAEPSNIKERQFAEAYLNEAQNSAKGIALRKRILRGANRHLEKEFFENLEVLVDKNPREANLGGVPNVLSKVKAYVRLRAARKDLVPDNTDLQMLGDDYVWALVFYLLRTGHIKEAVEYVTSNIVAFRAIDRNFITYISDYYNGEDRRLRRDLQERINSEYNQRARIAPEHSIDPFRMACYKVIGRCDITNRSLPGLNQTLEDWVWLQFNLAREVNVVEDFASDAFSLANVQDGIRTLGTRHFPTGGNPDQNSGFGMFFYLQILAGLFENAINFLYQYQYVDATHFSVALDYYGLLRVADLSATELLSHDTRGRPQINFAQMIGWYTRDFRAANVVAAVDYLTLICLNSDLGGDAGRQQVEICHQGLRELVLESREFAKLLGDMRLDGQRIKGAIEERMKLIGLVDTDDFMRTVTISAASIADDSGRTTDAVLLYHLAGEYDKVIHIINIALSEAVALDIGQDKITLMPLRPRVDQLTSEQQQSSSLSLTSVDDPIKLAQTICGIYNAHPMYYEKLTQVNKDTCRVLLRMSEAKDKVAEGRWTEALDVSILTSILNHRC